MKPTYEASLNFVVKGVAACLRNAERLARAAKRLLPTAPALALSVGVLSLEEVGKLLFVDGLLIAARDDYKTDAFREGQKKHHSKLGSLIRYLWALDWFAGLDPQRKADPVFLRTVHEKKVQWNEARKALAPWLGQDAALDGLDSWKQKGFYTDFSGGKIAEPEDVVSTDFATRVVHLASLTVDVLLFSSVATWSTTERRRWSCADRLRKSTARLSRTPRRYWSSIDFRLSSGTIAELKRREAAQLPPGTRPRSTPPVAAPGRAARAKSRAIFATADVCGCLQTSAARRTPCSTAGSSR